MNDVIDELIRIGMGQTLHGKRKVKDNLAGEVIQDLEFLSTPKVEDQLKALQEIAQLLTKNASIQSQEDKIASYIEMLQDVAEDE